MNFVEPENLTIFHAQRDRGHGLNVLNGIEEIPNNTRLLISVDSSTNDKEFCELLTKNRVDVLIIDHHKQEKTNQFATIINPNLITDTYPNKSLCGSQVVFKVIQTLDDYYSTNFVEEYYDLVSLATVGDCMDLSVLENRFMVDKGLKSIQNEGMRALLDCFKKDINKLQTDTYSYLLVPALNACCRLNKMELAIELLNSEDYFSASMLASEIIELNEIRKKTQIQYYEKFLPIVQKSINQKNKCIIIVDQEIGKGYRGLVAADFANEFQRTVFIVSEDKDSRYYSGSFRTYNDFNVREFLKNVPDLIEIVGHDSVGGGKFLKENLDKIIQYFNENIKDDFNEKKLIYLYTVDLNDLNESFCKDVEQFFRISGNGMAQGLFRIKNIRVLKKDILGKQRNTIKLTVYPHSKTYFLDKNEYDDLAEKSNLILMKFRTSENSIPDDIIGREIECVGSLNFNEFKRYDGTIKKSIQIFIEDYKLIS